MNQACVNIACGDSYIEGWRNFDYAPHSSAVSKASLLDRLPLVDGSADVVYSSHFLEHIPRSQVALFLSECFRITKSGGRLRLVLPDLEGLCSVYLENRQRGEHDRADFLILEMFDQCVRQVAGGELGAYYAHMQAATPQNEEMIKFVRRQTGHVIHVAPAVVSENRWARMLKNPNKILAKLEQWYCRAVLALLPLAFRQQNVSFATVGERHAWMYDFYSVEKLLRKAGFVDVQRMTATSSNIQDFPSYPLDATENGQPRKGVESMYIEAVKP